MLYGSQQICAILMVFLSRERNNKIIPKVTTMKLNTCSLLYILLILSGKQSSTGVVVIIFHNSPWARECWSVAGPGRYLLFVARNLITWHHGTMVVEEEVGVTQPGARPVHSATLHIYQSSPA